MHMVLGTLPTTIAQLDSELRAVETQTKSIRVEHCIRRFLVWRNAGYSPHEVMQRYKLSSYDMYGTILSAVQSETGLDRNDLLKYPGCGRGQRDATIRSQHLKEELSEVQRIISIYQDLTAQAEGLIKVIEDIFCKEEIENE